MRGLTAMTSIRATTRWRSEIRAAIKSALGGYEFSSERKTSESRLVLLLKEHLKAAGFEVDSKDRHQLLGIGDPAWRSRLTEDLYIPGSKKQGGRLQIDIVVYRDNELAGLIESENDLRHLCHNRQNKKESRYDVLSTR